MILTPSLRVLFVTLLLLLYYEYVVFRSYQVGPYVVPRQVPGTRPRFTDLSETYKSRLLYLYVYEQWMKVPFDISKIPITSG